MRTTLATLLTALLPLSGCGSDPEAPPPPPARPIVCTLPPGEAADLDALYDVSVSRGGSERAPERWEWRLWRRRDTVETRESRGDTGEVWRRDAEGRLLGCDRLFHVERRIIELQPGDLAATDAVRDWGLLSSLVDPRILGNRLERTGTSEAAGRPAEAYAGEILGADCEVLWVPSLGLPARLRRTRGGETVEFSLREVHTPGRAPWKRPDSGQYGRTDFADIGDAPTDPFLRRFSHAQGPVHPEHD